MSLGLCFSKSAFYQKANTLTNKTPLKRVSELLSKDESELKNLNF